MKINNRITFPHMSLFFMIILHLNCSSLFTAASKGDFTAVQDYINAGENINAKDASGLTALMYAATHGQFHIVKPPRVFP